MESALTARYSTNDLPYTRELLAEAEDEQLMKIVKEAAKELKSPIALVTVVMEQVQFFKAHYGLSEELFIGVSNFILISNVIFNR